MKTIRLVSPPNEGEKVRAAQRRLNGDNVFKTDYGISEVDGVFGEETMRACKRAKYWLGYPAKDVRGFYGEQLDGLLGGRTKLPPAFKKRRTERLKAYGTTPRREKALKRAITQIGTKESPPGTNKNKYGVWYGANQQPWCAMFCTWCYVLEGSKSMVRGERWAYVPWIVNAGRRGTYGFSITHKPQPGDLVCFDWEGNGIADHVGLFEKELPGNEFSCIEGNTAVGNDSNGGEVMRRKRNTSQVQAFVHVGG